MQRSSQLVLAAGAASQFAVTLSILGEAAAFNSSDYKALVCVFLQGGCDYANTVIPFDAVSYAKYAQIRGAASSGSLAVNQSDLTQTLLVPTTSLAEGRQYALNPAMTGMTDLFNRGIAAVQLNVGPLVMPLTRAQYASGNTSQYPIPPKLFSHNDQVNIWQTYATEGATEGWGAAG
jgi:uncharacterized protein (DUF1501 family)